MHLDSMRWTKHSSHQSRMMRSCCLNERRRLSTRSRRSSWRWTRSFIDVEKKKKQKKKILKIIDVVCWCRKTKEEEEEETSTCDIVTESSIALAVLTPHQIAFWRYTLFASLSTPCALNWNRYYIGSIVALELRFLISCESQKIRY